MYPFGVKGVRLKVPQVSPDQIHPSWGHATGGGAPPGRGGGCPAHGLGATPGPPRTHPPYGVVPRQLIVAQNSTR